MKITAELCGNQALTDVPDPTDDTLTRTLHALSAKLAVPSSVNVDAEPTSTQVVSSIGNICNLTVPLSQVPAARSDLRHLLKSYVELLSWKKLH